MKILLPLSVFLIACLQLSCGHSEGNAENTRTAAPTNTSAGNNSGGEVPRSECNEAIERLEALYNDLRSCTQDSDCNYINGPFAGGFFEVIARTQAEESVPAQDCVQDSSALRFLVAANGDSVENHSEEISDAVAHQQEACSTPGTIRCQGFTSFQSTPPPICEAGKCKRTAP